MNEREFPFKDASDLLPGLSLPEHSQQVQQLVDWLQQRGINVASSRIPKYKKFIDSLLERTEFDPTENPDDHKLFDELLYTLREVHELM